MIYPSTSTPFLFKLNSDFRIPQIFFFIKMEYILANLEGSNFKISGLSYVILIKKHSVMTRARDIDYLSYGQRSLDIYANLSPPILHPLHFDFYLG